MSVTGDDPPYLSVGTEVSAKYKGAFCEAKIKKVQRCIKCRVTYKQGLGQATVTDDQIKGTLRVGALVEAKYSDRKDYVEATINKIQDCSQYTVVFDDGDITTLRRSALCLKSGRHFAESETLDQLPLTHPEHFGYPVTGGRGRGRRSRQNQDGSSDEDDDDGARGSNDSGSGSGGKDEPEKEPEVGKVVCVELSVDKKKKDNWFPGLIVSPNAQDTVKINIRDEYLVRSFRDARYYTVPKKETTSFNKELGAKVENSALKSAVEKALQYLEKHELPAHWDRDTLFGNTVSSDNSDSDGDIDTASSDDEPREEKDHVVATLYKFMDDRGTPINQCPMIGNEDIDLYRLFRAVYKLGGFNRVTNQNQWKYITKRLGFTVQNNTSTRNAVKNSYKKYLHSFEDFYRKLGCTMVNHPRGSMRKQRPGRSLIRDKDRTATPNQDQLAVKTEKEEDEKEKKTVLIPEEEIKKEKIKKELTPKEEEVQPKVKRKEEFTEEDASGQESDVNIDAEEESSSSEKSQKSTSRLTPSSTISNKSKTMAPVKVKEEAPKKKPPVEKKKPEPKKQEKKEPEKVKEDDSAKTRSKSKEDVTKGGKSNSEVRETRTPSRESEKKPIAKPRRLTDDELKKRGRKKKETEGEKGKSSDERSVEYAPFYRGSVEIGDKLNVYYGPTHESKVTYEAKVIDITKDGSEPLYLVHYTGWNTRYDEWIKCSRIAQNYTQSQGRMKRTKTTPRPQTPSTNSSSSKSMKGTAPNAGTGASPGSAQNRRRAQGDSSGGGGSGAPGRDLRKDEREATPTTRSMTPSPLISNALRTKSPASTASNRSTRVTRNADSASSSDMGRRPRRSSGLTDAIAAEETETEDTDSLESDASASTPMQFRPRVRAGAQERGRREAGRRAESRMKIEDTSDAEAEKECEEPRRGKRLRKEEPPKGRDYDLNEIKAELKGYDKTVKLEVVSVGPDVDEDEDEQPTITIKQEKVEPENVVAEKKIAPEPEKKREVPKVEQQVVSPIKREIKVEPSQSDSTDDIYEFKEPEPFEFEVRNKRDSGGSSNSTDKEKDKEKDKPKKRTFEDESKSPKKRPKAFNAASTTPVKTTEQQKSTDNSPPEQQTTVDPKKKVRKIYKKNEEAEESVDADSEESTREISKFFPSTNYSNVMMYKRKGNFAANSNVKTAEDSSVEDSSTVASVIDSVVEDKDKSKRIGQEDDKSPKKRQVKTFGASAATTAVATATTTVTAAATTAATAASAMKISEIKPNDTSVIDENKKKPPKVFGKKPEEVENNIENDSSNKDVKFYPSYVATKTQIRKEEPDEASLAEAKEKPKKPIEFLSVKNVKKRQKTVATVVTGKADVNSSENVETKKKPVRKVPVKKVEDTEDTNGDSDDMDEVIITSTKYFSHYYGPKTKAAAANNENDSLKDRRSSPAVIKSEAQANEPSKLSIPPSVANATKEDSKLKIGEQVPSTSTTLASEQKQTLTNVDKKRGADSTVPNKTEPKSELKPLDFMPSVTHSLSVPAPLSARLPATASIEEKLSAAAVFRSKMKDTKKDEDSETTPVLARKTFKDMTKKTELTSTKKAQKDKEESKIKHEPEKKKQQEPAVLRKDILPEIEVRKDPLLEVIKKKEDDLLKVKKEPEPKTNMMPMSTTMVGVPKTYSNQKKETAAKLEEAWKKAAAMTSTVISSVDDVVANSLSSNEAAKDYPPVRKETIVNKIKSCIDRDSVDSTDSSDSERRLTIIDNEDFADEKGNESGSDAKANIKPPCSVTVNQYNNASGPPEMVSVVTSHNEVAQVVGLIGTAMQVKSAKMEEDGENLNSLLCEEEIPGSPTPGVESIEPEHRSASSQNLVKTDMGSKVAVAFVAAQLPLSTVPSSTQLTNCLVTTMSGSVAQSSNLVTVSMVQHASVQSLRQQQPQIQVPISQLHQPQAQAQALAQLHQQAHHQQQQQLQQRQLEQQQPPIAVLAMQQRRESNEAAPVMDNTPPRTPDSSISNLSSSPRNERTGGSTLSSSEDNSSKTHRDSSETENENVIGARKQGETDVGSSSLSAQEHRVNAGASSSVDRAGKTPPKRLSTDTNDGATSPKKRKKRKESDNGSGSSTQAGSSNASLSGKKSPRQGLRKQTGSDSDDDPRDSINTASVNNNNHSGPTPGPLVPKHAANIPIASVAAAVAINGAAMATPLVASAAPTSANSNTDWDWEYRPRSRYNFLPELGPHLSHAERIAIMYGRANDARKAYSMEQTNMNRINKHLKKIKRKKREAQRAAMIERQQDKLMAT